MTRSYVPVTIPMIQRMRDLRAVGLSLGAVQAVIALDYDAAPSVVTIRKYTSAWSPHADHDFVPGGNRGGRLGLSSGPSRRGATA